MNFCSNWSYNYTYFRLLEHHLVRKDDNSKWGICDPTFRSAGALKFDRDYVEFKRRPAIMMSPEEWTLTYESADEVAFKYIPREEIVEKSYNFVDDYRLVGGARLDPKNTRDLDATFTGIIDTIVKAKEFKGIFSSCVIYFMSFVL